MYTELVLDKPRNLRFDFRAIKELEARLGGDSTAHIVQRLQELSVTTLSAALWVGLKHQDPTLTPSLLDRILEQYFANGGSMQVLLRAVNQALLESGILKTDDDRELESQEPEVPGNGVKAATV